MSRWVLIKIKPRRERWASENLTRCNFEHYIPRALDEQHKPSYLFPGYGFVVHNNRFATLNSVWGVAKIVTFGEIPAFVDERVIEKMMKRHDASGFVMLDKKYKDGDKVRVTDGPFKDQLGIYQGDAEGKRIRVLLELFGKSVEAQIPKGFVSKS